MSREDLEKMEFRAYKSSTHKVLRELYGTNTANYKTMCSKLDQCVSSIQISKLLQWGRVNLL